MASVGERSAFKNDCMELRKLGENKTENARPPSVVNGNGE